MHEKFSDEQILEACASGVEKHGLLLNETISSVKAVRCAIEWWDAQPLIKTKSDVTVFKSYIENWCGSYVSARDSLVAIKLLGLYTKDRYPSNRLMFPSIRKRIGLGSDLYKSIVDGYHRYGENSVFPKVGAYEGIEEINTKRWKLCHCALFNIGLGDSYESRYRSVDDLIRELEDQKIMTLISSDGFTGKYKAKMFDAEIAKINKCIK